MKQVVVIIFFLLVVTGNVIAQVNINEPKVPYEPMTPNEYIIEIDEQDEKRILQNLPSDVRADLLKVKELDSERYQEMLLNVSHLSEFYIQDSFEKNRMETYKKIEQLEVQTESLGIQYQHSDAPEKASIKKNLQTKLTQLFDLKEKERRMEVEMLENELNKLKESLNVRKKNKDNIILRRLDELIGSDEHMDW